MKRRRPLAPKPVPYKHTGSTYDEDGIRITGSRKFVEAVLSRLTDLLEFENTETRLQVNFKQATTKDGRPMDSWVCYVQVHERGDEAQLVNAYASVLTGKPTIISKGY